MHKVEINLLRLDQHELNNKSTNAPARPHTLLRSLFGLIGVGMIVLSATTALSYQQSKQDTSALNQVLQSILFGSRPQFGETHDRTLNGEDQDRINILLLGVGGHNHDGPQLSDTNILLSVQPSTRSAAFISIPRDLLVPIEGYGWRKLNNANAFGEMEQAGSGILKAAAVVSKILNLPIHYTLRVDFDGFVDIVDILGGLDIAVDRSFTDYSYPTEDYKYQTVSFQSGPQTMNGNRALIFVRSRHSGMNNEGSDFARSARQQKVIAAMKEKIFSPSFLLNPQKISDVLSSLHDHIATDIKPSEFLRFLNLARSIDQDRMSTLVFDDGPENYLVSGSTPDGAYVLQPRDGTFEQMQIAVRDIFQMEVAQHTANKIKREHPTVSIQNGTSAVGLAGKLSTHLAKAGYSVVHVSNAQSKDVASTQLMDQTDGSKKNSKETLIELLPSSTITGNSPRSSSTPAAQSDFLIVLGVDAIDWITGQVQPQTDPSLHAASPSPGSAE